MDTINTDVLGFKVAAEFIYDEIFAKKGRDVVHVDVKGYSPITDDFVICTLDSMTQLKSLASGIERRLLKEMGIKTSSTKSTFTNSGWVVLDYFDFMVHIFLEQDRNFYNIEKLFDGATLEEIPEPAAPADAE